MQELPPPVDPTNDEARVLREISLFRDVGFPRPWSPTHTPRLLDAGLIVLADGKELRRGFMSWYLTPAGEARLREFQEAEAARRAARDATL